MLSGLLFGGIGSSTALGRPPPGTDPTLPLSQWYANQKNMMGGSCCMLGDGHELDPGDVRFDEETGLYSVRLPDASEETFGRSLNDPYEKPKVWVEVPALRMRDPAGGPPPGVGNPIVWFDTGSHGLVIYDADQPKKHRIYCFEPNTQF